MKFLFDLFPIIFFFIAYKIAGVYVATLVAMLTAVAQVTFSWFKHRKVDPMLWAGLALIIVFGGATLLLHDEIFIKWKPTILYWLLALSLLVSAFFFKKNLIKAAMSQHIAIANEKWSILNIAWCLFFIILGIANLYIAYYYPTDVWVNFKLFGSTGLTLIFVIAQSIWVAQHVQNSDQS